MRRTLTLSLAALATTVAALGAVLGIGLSTAGPAVAHTNADAQALCGGGYNYVGHRNDDFNDIRVFRFGNSWCAVALKLSDHGTATYMWVGIKANSQSTYNNVNQGNFAHFAGPVYAVASTCVDVQARQTYRGVTYSHGGNCLS